MFRRDFMLLAGLALTPKIALGAGAQATKTSQHVNISHGYSTFGDLKYPSDFKHFDYANPAAPRGGTISQRQLYGSPTFDSLNIFIIKGDPAPEVGQHMYDSLMVRAYDEPDALYGLVAETIEYPDDLSWIVFNMRAQAKFHDGSPVLATDVVFTIHALKTMGHPYYRNLLADVVKVTATDHHRVRFDLAPGAGRSLPGNIAELPVLPEHFYGKDHPFDQSWMATPLGSGPYRLAEVDPPQTIRFRRDLDYWAKDLPVNVGKNNFERFDYEYFVDDSVSLQAFSAGQYTMRVEYRSASWATGYDFPAVQKGWVKKLMIADAQPANAQGIWFNLRRPELQDIRVRRAIEMAFNFEWTNKTLFYGAYKRTVSFFENTEMKATGVPNGAELALLEPFREQLPASVFTEPAYVPYAGAATPRDRRALRAASELLNAAGWTAGEDGKRRNAGGDVLHLEFIDDNSGLSKVMIPFTENLQALGIECTFQVIDPSQYTQRRQKFDFDMTDVAWSVAVTPGAELRSYYGSKAAGQEGSNNLSGIADPVVDALIEKVVSAGSREELTVAARALDRVLRAKVIWIGNWYLGAQRVAVWDIFGRPQTPAPYDSNRNVEFWWYEQAKYDALKAAGAFPG